MKEQPGFPEANKQGYSIYSARSLALYDTIVLSISNRLLWRCPSSHLLAHYNENLSGTHLDIGVGTGYFLDKAVFPTAEPTLVLMDPNQACLDKTHSRIKRYAPELRQADALVPWSVETGEFASIGLNYVLHCLPGTMAEKAIVFDHLQPHLKEGGSVFGATILQGDSPRSFPAQKLMDIYNKKGVFSNEKDTLQDLEIELGSRFDRVNIYRIGCVALFSAVK